MTQATTYTIVGNLAVVEIASPPVNALGQAVRLGIVEAINSAGADDAVAAIIITGQGRSFSAGADIREFGKPPLDPSLPAVCNLIEDCAKPVIAAVNGIALGGGMEVALAAHFRIAAQSASFGLPEVTLGIVPGAGGTQRLPRIIGVQAAIGIMTDGKPIDAARALELGIVDRICTGELGAQAQEYAREITDTSHPIRRSRDRSVRGETEAQRSGAIAEARTALDKTARNLVVPFKIVDCVEAAFERPFDDGLAFERAAFVECLQTDQSKGLRHAFAAERRAAKFPEAETGEARPLAQIGVVGGGTMGAGIAVAALGAGLHVTMVERDGDAIARGSDNVEKVYDRKIAKGRMNAEQKSEVLARFQPSTDYGDLGQADLVVEAVFEDLAVKKAVFGELDRVTKPGAVLATNTSHLDIGKIAASISRPGDVIGLHFFSPANIMKLLEIVVPDGVGDDVVATGLALAKAIRKVPVRAGICDGFIGNRILAAYRRAADYMMEDGASPYEIDAALRDFGFAMGPFEVSDLAGGDIGWATRKRKAATRPANERYVEIADRMCERGWFGQKTGRGFYDYAAGSRKGVPNPEIASIIAAEQAKKGIAAREFAHEEILRRYMAAMINEAANVLADGIAVRPSDIDVVLLYGYGFPRYRGGPMKYADTYGLDRILSDIRTFASEDAQFWTPSPLLSELVEKGATFDGMNGK